MATVNKNFKIKQGLIVEGTEATVAGNDILTKKQADQDYIVNLAGGGATTNNEPNKVVKRDSNCDFSAGTISADLVGDVTGDLTGNADTATALETARTIELTGDITGSVSFDGTANVQIQTSLDADFATDAEVATAKQEAINAASADATTKANAAEQNAIDSANSYTDSAIAQEVTDRNSAIATAKTQAQDYSDAALAAYAAQDSAQSSLDIAAAVSQANGYTDAEIIDALATASADATQKANAAESSANSHTDDAISQEVLDRNAAISSAISTEVTDRDNAISSAITNLNLSGTYDALGAAAQALEDANDYTNTAVANLVDAAPGALDTLNELAAALGNDANFSTTLTNSLALKADTTYVNSEISDLDTAAQGYASTAESNAISSANTYTNQEVAAEASDRNAAISSAIATEVTNRNTAIDAAILSEAADRDDAIATAKSQAISTASDDATAKANAAQSAAQTFATNADSALYVTVTSDIADAASQAVADAASYANSLATNYDPAGSAATAESNAADFTTNAINALDTDDIEEGTSNKYFTDSRAQSAVAGDIQSAVNDVNATIDALTTSDIAEGSNQYFTNQRAIDAVGGNINDAIAAGNSNASPTYQEINFTWATKQIGTYTWVPNSGVATVYEWNGNSFPAAKFLVRVREGQHSQVSEVLVTKDDNGNVAITEYAIVHTNGILGDISAEFANGTYSLTVNAVNNSTEVIVSGMLLAYGD